MPRRKRTEETIEEVNQEVVTEQSTEITEEVKEDAQENQNETPEDEVMEDSEKNETTEDSDNEEDSKESEDSKSAYEKETTEETLITRVSILERTFTKKVKEVAVFDVYRTGKQWQFKDKNGILINTSYTDLKSAMRIFIARLFPVDKRAKGISYSWTEIN